MPLNREGTLTPDEVYGLTAYLLFINGVIPEDQVLDQQNLAAVKMPLGDSYAPLPDWKPRTPRLKGYPTSGRAETCTTGTFTGTGSQLRASIRSRPTGATHVRRQVGQAHYRFL